LIHIHFFKAAAAATLQANTQSPKTEPGTILLKKAFSMYWNLSPAFAVFPFKHIDR